jgi:hypothetical protein
MTVMNVRERTNSPLMAVVGAMLDEVIEVLS